MRRQAMILSLVGIALVSGRGLADDAATPATQEQPSAVEMNEQETAFQELLKDAVLVGTFSVDGRNGTPKPERYTIGGVTKVAGDRWIVPGADHVRRYGHSGAGPGAGELGGRHADDLRDEPVDSAGGEPVHFAGAVLRGPVCRDLAAR